jgi:hypothetical protein
VASTILGLTSILLGVRTPARGIYYALGGILVSGIAGTTALLTTKLSSWIFVEF